MIQMKKQIGFYNHVIPSEFKTKESRMDDMIIERINHYLIKSRRDDIILAGASEPHG
jgi:hypothetical protein